jgi:hypothetical protein
MSRPTGSASRDLHRGSGRRTSQRTDRRAKTRGNGCSCHDIRVSDHTGVRPPQGLTDPDPPASRPPRRTRACRSQVPAEGHIRPRSRRCSDSPRPRKGRGQGHPGRGAEPPEVPRARASRAGVSHAPKTAEPRGLRRRNRSRTGPRSPRGTRTARRGPCKARGDEKPARARAPPRRTAPNRPRNPPHRAGGIRSRRRSSGPGRCREPPATRTRIRAGNPPERKGERPNAAREGPS